MAMTVLILCSAVSLLSVAFGHGLLTNPNPRGTLKKWDFNPYSKEIDPNAPIDFWPHFPAGPKTSRPGIGKESQLAASMPEGWTPFEPMKPGFKWRAGVCGDTKWGNEHMRGGKYYHGGMIAAEYQQGGTMKVELNIVAHHNGFIEFHVCDVAKCGGEISEACFKQGHCQQLKRAQNYKCDNKKNFRCAPIDPNYPGRWYLPCSPHYPEVKFDFYGADDTILYKLPDNLHCEHCVLHFFWTAANSCNPPGVREFFEGPHAPEWPRCPGQGGAVGGYSPVQGPCGGRKLPEEYYSCTDIRIVQTGMRKDPAPPTKPPTTSPPKTTEPNTNAPQPNPNGGGNSRTGVIKDLILVADGQNRGSIKNGDEINISGYNNIAIECVTSQQVDMVQFYIDGKWVWTERQAPYFLFGNGNGGPFYWKNPIINRPFQLVTKAGSDTDTVTIKFLK